MTQYKKGMSIFLDPASLDVEPDHRQTTQAIDSEGAELFWLGTVIGVR